ncbi:ASCH domain-containing protein [Salinibacterium sp. NG253]|uniref:ASCH domain-containing protein n=1 Tax=Salinibacterium sp. NG253 TaxID=2792039 RepID=UPI0018CEE52D|nr:ASCH domain-containing protein [Salinibacterium sp. NG253]
MTRALFLSLKPRYARAILEGRKTIEVRRKFPVVPEGTMIVLYSSSPERAVLGTVSLKRTTRIDPSQVWNLHADAIEISKAELTRYLHGAPESTLLEVENPSTWNTPVPLSALRKAIGVEPPQSFRYLETAQVELMQSGVGAA